MIKRIERADGTRFQVYGQANGKKIYVGTYGSNREATAAEEEHRVTERKRAEGKLPPAVDTKRLFGKAVKVWLKTLEDGGSRSFEEYESRVELYLGPFENVPLVDIRKSDVIAFRDDLGKRVAAATVNTVLGTFSAAFTFFIGRDWLEHNPCNGVKRLKPDARVFPWLQSTEAITKLLGQLAYKWRTLVAVLVGTGMRLDEALHLRWDDIDLEHRLITVHRGRQGTTKSGNTRRVPIFDSVLVVLKEMKVARGDAAVLLWPGGRPGKPLSQPSLRKPFKAALRRLGYPENLRLHDLRHTFASLYLVDGGDIFKLSRILGHNSVAITERTYAHLKPDAFEMDYGRVAFRMPSDDNVVPFSAVA
jgi:integrase